MGAAPGMVTILTVPGTDGQRELRKAGAAHAWKTAKAVQQIGVELSQRGVLVSGLPGIQVEQQHVLLIEAEFHRLKIGKRAPEQAGRHHQQQRDGDLRGDQRVTEADPEAQATARSALRTGAGFLQRGREIHLRRLNGGSQTEDQPGRQRQGQREAQHRPVQACVKREVFASVGQQPGDRTDSPERHQHSEQSAGQGQQRALGQQLAHHAQASRAQAEAHRHLAPPGRGARQQEVGDVGAGDGENQADHRHEYVERFGVAPPQRVQAARAFLEPQHGQVGFLLRGGCGALDERMEPSRQRGLGLAHADAGAQAAHHFQPVIIVVEEPALLVIGGVRGEQRGGVQGQVHLGIRIRVDTEEPGRGNSDDGERSVVDQDRPSDGGGAAGEAALPVLVTENRHGRRPAAIVVVRDQASGRGRHAEAAVETARHEQPIGDFGLVLRHQVDLPRRGIREQGGQRVLIRAQKLKRAERVVGAARCPRYRRCRVPFWP